MKGTVFMEIKVCQGYVIRFCTAAPKTGKPGGPRLLEHAWSVTEQDRAEMVECFENGITVDGVKYAFEQNYRLGDHPKFKGSRPVWSGMAVVNGTSYECHMTPGTVPVRLDE